MQTYTEFKHYFMTLFLALLSSISHADKPLLKDIMKETVIAQTPHAKNEEIKVNILQFDESNHLQKCESPLSINLSKSKFSNQNNVIVVSCHDANPWEFFVPIQIQIMTPVLTSKRLIKPGEIISEDDLIYEKADKNQLHDGYFTDMNDIVGLTPIHTYRAGVVFTPKNLKPIPLIKKNQMVNLALRTGGIEIYMTGITKSDGYKNEIIKILNPSSKKIVDAIVVDKDQAEIIY